MPARLLIGPPNPLGPAAGTEPCLSKPNGFTQSISIFARHRVGPPLPPSQHDRRRAPRPARRRLPGCLQIASARTPSSAAPPPTCLESAQTRHRLPQIANGRTGQFLRTWCRRQSRSEQVQSEDRPATPDFRRRPVERSRNVGPAVEASGFLGLLPRRGCEPSSEYPLHPDPPELGLLRSLGAQASAIVARPRSRFTATCGATPSNAPEYVGRSAADPYLGPEVKDADTIAATRPSRIAAEAFAGGRPSHQTGGDHRPTRSDRHEFLDHGAYHPHALGIPRLPKSLCTSLREVICHGIRLHGRRRRRHRESTTSPYSSAESTATRTRDVPGRGRDEESRRNWSNPTKPRCARSGCHRPTLNVVGRVIESYAKRFGYGVVRDFTGTGSARRSSTTHRPALRRPSANLILETGMTFTIEPMLTLGTINYYEIWDDGWTVVTRTRKRTAVRTPSGHPTRLQILRHRRLT